MLQTTDIEALLNQTEAHRLRFEHVVNELLENGLLTEEGLVISPERTSAYNFERDIQEISDRSDDQHQAFWQITVPRDGFYDTLPERLFHRAKKRTKDEDEWSEIRQKEEKQEEESRHFFLPFDSAFNRQRAAIARFETQVLEGIDEALLTELLRLMAPQTDALPLRMTQKLTLFLLIVRAHQLVGNWSQTAHYFSNFLEAPVQIQYSQQGSANRSAKPANDWQPNRLGTGQVGIDWVLPQSASSSENPLIRLAVGPLTGSQLSDFLPDGVGLKYIQLVADYLFPADVDWQLDLMPDASNDYFQLSTLGTTGRLGMTTQLTH